ncbi:CLUMA_CG020023, isoform A [Clunio marinus]|uniref:CLUMA_CG020023, isoform A n=1 Tax=Clunio marinus TaxID=568069 RepID=A0A1J1J3P1_9DIPT|nr:CLUMA_CG020023, isoform A [Clunio marinus]
MSQHLIINLSKSDEGSFGFSLLGKFAGIPHVIYDVIEDSPAAESEKNDDRNIDIGSLNLTCSPSERKKKHKKHSTQTATKEPRRRETH